MISLTKSPSKLGTLLSIQISSFAKNKTFSGFQHFFSLWDSTFVAYVTLGVL